MTVRGTLSTEALSPAIKAIDPLPRVDTFLGRGSKAGRRALVVFALVFSDVLLALAVWQVAFALQGVIGQGPLSYASVASILPNVIVWIGLRAVLGLYPGYGLTQVEDLRRQTYALLATVAIITSATFASQVGDLLSRVLFFAWCLGLLASAPASRYLVKRAMMKCGMWGKTVVVLGAREAGRQVVRALRREWQLGFQPLAVFDDRVVPTEGWVEGVPYGGGLDDATTLAHKNGIDTAIFAMPHARHEHMVKFVNHAGRSFRHVIVIPNLGGVTNSAVVARDLAGTFGVEIRYNLLDVWSQRVKRALDIVVTVVGGVLILPVLATLCLLVLAESGGPIFYADKRMGRDGRLFSCIKFRTMVPDAEGLLQRMLAEDASMREEYLTYHKLRHDPRVTRMGRFLRKTSLDELPQLWNVLRGDMSLVGPRPYLPRESEDIGETQGEILRVTPGITGPWQVAGRSQTSFGERVAMDAHYVREWSVWLDLVLLASTAWCLLSRHDAY
jgi:Undecaprenyl-phosphate galactose phosphotransferase WbaP